MNKSMLTGVIAGIAVATTGGVAGYALLGDDSQMDENGSALVIDEAVEQDGTAELQAPAPAAPVAARQAPTPQPTRVAQTAPQPVAAPAPQPAPVAEEECWDEEVTVQVDPKDDNAIAGTAAGAVIGGALAKNLGDDNDLVTAAGAAAGGFFGRRAQKRMQENKTETVIERRCAPAGTRN